MTRTNTILVSFALAMIALVGGIYAGSSRSDKATPEQVPTLADGSIAHLFAGELRDANGKPYPMAQWKGKTLIVNFWAPWCPPCREEMPGFSRLQAKYAANGVQFVGIALDTVDNVQAFSSQFPVTYPLLIGDQEGNALAQQLGNPQLALPYTLIVGPQGDLRFAHLGAIAERDLDTQVQQSLAR